jgi:TfoX/Sxy family transcriptional regulator of competence genes
VPYDEDLADRIRELLATEDGVTEKKMFGGLAFLIGGHLAIGASGQGGIMVRVEPAETEALLATTAATPMVMRGRDLDGWVRVGADEVRTKRQLSAWARRGVAYAHSLPPKPPSVRRT